MSGSEIYDKSHATLAVKQHESDLSYISLPNMLFITD